VVLACCTGSATRGDQAPSETLVQRSIEEVQDAHTPEWMSLPGVVGTGIGLCEDRPCIKVFVAGPVSDLRDRIPAEVEGYTVVLESTGPFEARDSAAGPDRTGR
jgi:hypothetical protein